MKRPIGFEKLWEEYNRLWIGDVAFVIVQGSNLSRFHINGKVWGKWPDIIWIRETTSIPSPLVGPFGEWVPLVYMNWENNTYHITKVKFGNGLVLKHVADGIFHKSEMMSLDGFLDWLYTTLTNDSFGLIIEQP